MSLFKRLFSKDRKLFPSPLYLHNTLSGKDEEFKPLRQGYVRLYTCGPTAYDRQHIGNLFPSVIANVLRRILSLKGYKVQEVNNITDFGHLSDDEGSEDKMTKGLKREGMPLNLQSMRALAEKYTTLFLEDLPPLGVNPKDISYPRASDYVGEQIALIKALVQKGYAYTTKNGVYFETSKYKEYGKLGGLDLEGPREARIVEDTEKKRPEDFALWKKDRALGWQSPWGKGFPGWHTECVAMIFALLGRQIDIHMGGIDLRAIHHNNEIAQAESATGKEFARFFVHNAHITVEGKKISKSLGNTIYLHNVVERGFSPRALRYWFLTGHYRTPMNFTWEALEGASRALNRLYKYFFESLPDKEGPLHMPFVKAFTDAVSHDLDTPKAIALMWDFIKDEKVSPASKRSTLLFADSVLGLGLDRRRTEVLKVSVVKANDLPEEIRVLVERREKARTNKQFDEADFLREELKNKGYVVEDSPEGPVVRKVQ